MEFPPLLGAEAEVLSVAELLGGDGVLRLGAEARETELKAVQSPPVLVLATHGFFLSDQDLVTRTLIVPICWPAWARGSAYLQRRRSGKIRWCVVISRSLEQIARVKSRTRGRKMVCSPVWKHRS